MDINQMILIVLAGFLVVSAIDYVLGSKIGLGEKFMEAFRMMGPLALVIVGIVAVAPILAEGVQWVSHPLHAWLGVDPAALMNTFLALDLGGYALAVELGESEAAALFAWVFIGSIYGATIAFTVPVAIGLLRQEDVPFFTRGILFGLVCAPFGCMMGGLVAGFSLTMMVVNLIPALLLSGIIAAGLMFYQKETVRLFTIVGKGVTVVATIGIVLLGVEALLPFLSIPGLAPLSEGMTIVGQVVLVLAGAFPLVHVLTRVLERPLEHVGGKIGLNEKAGAGLLASLAHAIPAFAMFPEMNNRGKIIVAAFCVSGAFVLGGHLGFVAGINADVVFAMVVGKLGGGLTAVMLAWTMTRPADANEA
ncbi:ethanolamine utilization protein EutH [Salicibibacter kimchii]|uniref:Ethanolamine utilization protein EutH n=1 Tax=Salicibibacter kimchii TaxID=2099786 RepID=A0A345C2N7_9BACI|nr:ethanolamine utilization protein EutH [Salicibibacter kimchii]AXF57468.1 ethanolamine utilization protein EutH [Salicibibacter kimchii]